MRKLTPKQLLFVKEYPVDLNATKAAIRAGYSPKTARLIGQENLLKPAIKELLDQDLRKRCEKLDLTAEDVLEGVRKIAFNEVEGETVSIGHQLIALTKLMEYFGLLKQRTVHENPDGSPLVDGLAKAMAKIAEGGNGFEFRQRSLHN